MMAKAGKDVFGFVLLRGISYHIQGRGNTVYRFTAGNVVRAADAADFEFLKSHTVEGGSETPRFALVDLNKGKVTKKTEEALKSNITLIPKRFRSEGPSKPALKKTETDRLLEQQKAAEKQNTQIINDLTEAHLDDGVLEGSIEGVCSGARLFLEAASETPLPEGRAIKALRSRVSQDPHERKTLPQAVEEIIKGYEE